MEKEDELVEQYRTWVEMIRLLADDPTVPERSLRSAIKFIAVDQRLTPKEIAHARELAARHGWLEEGFAGQQDEGFAGLPDKDQPK